MKKVNSRLVIRRETLAELAQGALEGAAGGSLLPPPSYRPCLPSHVFFGCGNPPIVV